MSRCHSRKAEREGGYLSVDIAGPFAEGMPVTDRPVAMGENPKYFQVGALGPISVEEPQERHDRELEVLQLARLEGPVPMEDNVDDGKRSVYYVEILNSKRVTETLLALLRIFARIESQHRCKAVFRVHADRAQ